MTTRFRCVLAIGALTALLVLPAQAGAAQDTSVWAELHGKVPKVTLLIEFEVPGGTDAAAACSGTVKGSVRPDADAKVLRSSAAAAVDGDGDMCEAHLKFTLPKACKGEKRTFRYSFAGNTIVNPFSGSKALRVK